MHTSYTKHKRYQLLTPILHLFIKFCLFTPGLSFFCGVNGVENGLLTCDQAVLILFLFGRRKWKLRTRDRRLWVINSNCFIHSSFGVTPWMWITFTLCLTGNQFTLFNRFCGLVCGTCKVFQTRAKVALKISLWLVSKDAVTRRHRSCSLLIMGS